LDVLYLLEVLWRYDLLVSLIKTIGFVFISYFVASSEGQNYFTKIFAFIPPLTEFGIVFIDIERLIDQEPVLEVMRLTLFFMILVVWFIASYFIVETEEQIRLSGRDRRIEVAIPYFIFSLVLIFPIATLIMAPPLLDLIEILYKICSGVSWIIFIILIIYSKIKLRGQ